MLHVYGYPERPEEGVRSSKAGVTGVCEMPDVDAVKQTQIPTMDSQCASPEQLSKPHLSPFFEREDLYNLVCVTRTETPYEN